MSNPNNEVLIVEISFTQRVERDEEMIHADEGATTVFQIKIIKIMAACKNMNTLRNHWCQTIHLCSRFSSCKNGEL